MTESPLTCREELRRDAVRAKQGLHGLDYVEVSDDQRELRVIFLGKAPEQLAQANLVIEGGRRIRDIRIVGLEIDRQEDPELDDCMVVTVERPGDFSTYTLCVVEVDKQGQPVRQVEPQGRSRYRPLRGFDPRYACIEFSFKAGCPSDLDCASPAVCPPPERAEPEINYLAKDYVSFRQLILDRLALLIPDWQERHVPDVGIALVELLAYVGDYLSYYQDAAATEAYLETARQRISIRRHVRLVDYTMHQGCNARTWVCVRTDTDWDLDPQTTYFISGRADESQDSAVLTPDQVRKLLSGSYEVFEPLLPGAGYRTVQSIRVYKDQSEIHFYAWGDRECCLARGATSATLIGAWAPPGEEQDLDPGEGNPPVPPIAPHPPRETSLSGASRPQCTLHLRPGDVLLFEEVVGPKTGFPADADPTHRHAVRLTRVVPARDALYDQPIVGIEWAPEDALPFPVCISAISQAPACTYLENVSVACGNVLLVDHGQKHDGPPLTVPTETTMAQCASDCQPAEISTVPGKFRPRLQKKPLTFSQPLPSSAPASALLLQDPRQALPWIRLTGTQTTPHGDEVAEWFARPDLFSSQRNDPHFVVEMDNDGFAHVRFGDGDLGRIPDAGTVFQAMYRVGNGPAGNVGAEAIRYIVSSVASGVNLRPRNPLPAQGGTPPESLAEVRLFAPYAFRKVLERAITAGDYAALAGRNSKLQRAAAALRWTGSWYEALVTLDPLGTEEVREELLREITIYLDRYRRLGHDLVVGPGRYVPLDVAMTVCVLPHYLRGHVEAALLDVLSNRLLPDGRRGFFHPDNLTFGEGVDLSKLVATAQAVVGVESVIVTRFQRLFEKPNQELENGILPLGPLEIAQLDNDPSFPEHGKLMLDVRGGR